MPERYRSRFRACLGWPDSFGHRIQSCSQYKNDTIMDLDAR